MNEESRLIAGLKELLAAEESWSKENEGGLYWLHRRLRQWIEEVEGEREDCCSACRDVVYGVNTCDGFCGCHSGYNA